MVLLDLHSLLSQAIAFGGGILLHIAAYRKGEWDLAIPKVLSVYAIIQCSLVAWTQLQNGPAHEPLLHGFKAVVWLGTLHAVGIVSSMVVYRLLFHRLRSFPGPFWARLTNGYHTVLTAKKLHLYEEVEVLHKQYGDFVRIGNAASEREINMMYL